MAKWLGFMVLARIPGGKTYRHVGAYYATHAGAETFMNLYRSLHRDADCYVSEKIQREDKGPNHG